ncbi:hypothetical protein Csa_012587, partial [Cucumis sativus]
SDLKLSVQTSDFRTRLVLLLHRMFLHRNWNVDTLGIFESPNSFRYDELQSDALAICSYFTYHP